MCVTYDENSHFHVFHMNKLKFQDLGRYSIHAIHTEENNLHCEGRCARSRGQTATQSSIMPVLASDYARTKSE